MTPAVNMANLAKVYLTYLLQFTQKLWIVYYNDLQWVENPYSTLIIGANVAVDSFFLMSGLLVAWSLLKNLDDKYE